MSPSSRPRPGAPSATWSEARSGSRGHYTWGDVHLVEPMRFDRADPDEHSLVERAVLAGLGVSSYHFSPTAPRQAVAPERVRRQERMKVAEEQRLAADRG